MSFDTGNRVANENGWDRSKRARRFDFRPAGLMRHFCIILLTLALAVPLTLQAAGTVTDQNGKSYRRGDRLLLHCRRGLLFAENMVGVKRTIQTGSCSSCAIPSTSAFGPEPSCLTTRVSRLGGSGKPAAFVVYVAPDPKRGVAPVITEQLAAGETRGVDFAATDESACKAGQQCIPCFGGCCCR